MSNVNLDAVSSSKASGSAKSLVKGIALVDLVATSDAAPRLVDLVECSGLPRPTALRLLDVLCRADVLRVEAQGTYTLGPRVVGWGQSFLNRVDLQRHASDLVEELVAVSGETCFLGVLDRNTVLYIGAVHSPHAIRPAARVGSRMPLHSTGIGKALLAWSDEAERDSLLPEPLERRTPNTITNRAALSEHLDGVRTRGYAIDEIENEDGVRCVAAPIRDHTGTTVAALSVSAPAYRFSADDLARLAPELVRVTDRISQRLGHVLDPATDGTRKEEADE
ncbi:MAG: IclR family transcriptional regulator [Nocardioidaceae bacterium]